MRSVLTNFAYLTFNSNAMKTYKIIPVFIAAFLALAWDLRMPLNKKIIMLAIGIGGTILANVFRITTLFFVGLYYGRDAMFFMHTHLGWILYFMWITVFWFIAFRVGGAKTAKKYDNIQDLGENSRTVTKNKAGKK